MPRIRLAALVLVCAIALPVGAAGQGAANGKVGIITNASRAYGFSSYSGEWTTRTLSGPAVRRLASDYLGYVRTAQRIYSFNATNDRWIESTFSGAPVNESIAGATSLFWSTSTCYGTSTIWLVWHPLGFSLGELVRGGGSANNFGVVWTTQRALAYSSAGGTWIAAPLTSPAIGGIASDGLGLVWTSSKAYAFESGPRTWSVLDLGGPTGVSAAGDGSVALVWSETQAQAFSGISGQWIPAPPSEAILGGAAGGEVGVLWGSTRGWAFDANTDQWIEVPFMVPANGPDVGHDGLGFSVGPNPVLAGDALSLALPAGGDWDLTLFDVTGALVASLEVRDQAGGEPTEWVPESQDGRRLAAGVYWVRAESGRRVEARRIVVVSR